MANLLETIQSPADLKRLNASQMEALAEEIRDFLIQSLAITGGHLGPNLGVVELSLALHAVFETPKDKILFDVSHQSYIHKILTGRRERFDTIRMALCCAPKASTTPLALATPEPRFQPVLEWLWRAIWLVAMSM
jgi:1-deoxy-D-xylulose-5-phosphate synthase